MGHPAQILATTSGEYLMSYDTSEEAIQDILENWLEEKTAYSVELRQAGKLIAVIVGSESEVSPTRITAYIRVVFCFDPTEDES
jgi:hypothetical protein